MRKCTKKWTTRDGTKIRICDMTDRHLRNAIKLCCRMSRAAFSETLSAMETVECMVSGEQASYDIAMHLDRLLSDGPDQFLHELFEDLTLEAERRGLEVEVNS